MSDASLIPGLDWDDRIAFDEEAALAHYAASQLAAAAVTPPQPQRSRSRYGFGLQLAEPVPGHVILLNDVEIQRGPASGTIKPFATEVKTSESDSWLLVTSIFVVNAASAHGRRVELIAINPTTSQPLQIPASKLTSIRRLPTAAPLTDAARDSVKRFEEEITAKETLKAQRGPHAGSAEIKASPRALRSRHDSDAHSTALVNTMAKAANVEKSNRLTVKHEEALLKLQQQVTALLEENRELKRELKREAKNSKAARMTNCKTAQPAFSLPSKPCDASDQDAESGKAERPLKKPKLSAPHSDWSRHPIARSPFDSQPFGELDRRHSNEWRHLAVDNIERVFALDERQAVERERAADRLEGWNAGYEAAKHDRNSG